MVTTIQKIRLHAESIPQNVRYAAWISINNYYWTTGQFKPVIPIITSSPAIKKPLTPPLPDKLTFIEHKLWQVNPHDHQWRQKFFDGLPGYMIKHFTNKYIILFETKGRRAANSFLRDAFTGDIKNRLAAVNKKYHTDKPTALSIQFNNELDNVIEYSREQLIMLSERLAAYIQKAIYNFLDNKNLLLSKKQTQKSSLEILTYQFILAELSGLTVYMPYHNRYANNQLTDEQATIALAKITLSDWWQNQLKRLRDMKREHLAIAVGLVQKRVHPYASQSCVNEWSEQKRRNRHFIKRMAIENEDTHEQFPLTDVVDKSRANPAIRRCELMVRIRGFENIAEKMGCMGEFLTLTAPSKYHSVYNKGGFIKNWNGCSPQETQRYLCSIFARIRAKLNRDNLKIFGFRVVEPHHDGTPHWHLLLFMLPEQRMQILEIFKHYALAEDGHEKGALENRFKAISIDKTFGSATGYIAKYISKNIDGYMLEGEKDFETDADLKKVSRAITAWASRWKIRQFQQIGGAPVTVWRELRRLKEQKITNQPFALLLAAANIGDWAAYTALQGGPMVTRKSTSVRPCYKNEVNQFNEIIKKIQGVFSPLLGLSSFICTRLVKWSIVKKLNVDQKNIATDTNQNVRSWSSVNNYTRALRNDSSPPEKSDKQWISDSIVSDDTMTNTHCFSLSERKRSRFNQQFTDSIMKLNFNGEVPPKALI